MTGKKEIMYIGTFFFFFGGNLCLSVKMFLRNVDVISLTEWFLTLAGWLTGCFMDWCFVHCTALHTWKITTLSKTGEKYIVGLVYS
jgi:hypothetical protein